MAITKAKDLRELSVDEINRRIRDLKLEGINLKLQKATGALENPARIRAIRRENARLVTILAQRSTKA
ncbi:MAG TPA: 50S ribosomal protein L29 [Verrucomicrobiales bacterium]|jgi:large subunit ribosomal protein L29|nr:MAG: 50S ribosomal protein L29 [Verrucomicrobiae bacterium Tous-C3TDCM]PAZ04269.1 MAG: 50S ribosomal protein L29 [Verrucomicrobiae bacterium AMD-G2]HBE22544.1 50S ribosomal protein L29 [Verrucomicrobiales bacterium]